MIDFTELPSDGVKFEQLIRELLIRSGFDVHWTGVGPDGGRVVATENCQGRLAPFERRWLVSCKHYATSGKSVGIEEVNGILDACAAVDASGFLLACSTQPSSAVVRRLEEIEASKNLITRYWDGIEIEKRLNFPSTFALINIFLPKSSMLIPWRIYNVDRPSFWAANYKEYFLYLASRTSNLFPSLKDVEEIVRRLESIDLPKGSDWEKHFIRPRAVYFDDKHEQYSVFADYLYPHGEERSTISPDQINESLKDGQGLYSDDDAMWYLTHWDISYVPTRQISDHFHLDHKSYYEPYMDNFQIGHSRESFISESEWVGDPDIIHLS